MQQADETKISQMQTKQDDLESQLEKAKSAQETSKNEVQTLNIDVARLQQQVNDKQSAFDKLVSDKQTLENISSQQLSAKQSELETLMIDKEHLAQELTMKQTKLASLHTLIYSTGVKSNDVCGTG